LQTIDFDFRPLYDGVEQMVPVVESRSLADLAGEFESQAGYEPARGYAGLVLEHDEFGDLGLYLMGEQVPRPYLARVARDRSRPTSIALGTRVP
jgi:hypothetical protein